MTEDNIPKMEIQVEQGYYRAVVRADSWFDVLTQARVAKMKMRIAEITCQEIEYDFTENRWYLSIPKDIGPVRNRILCALLFSFPLRITKDELEILSSVNMASLRNYLTKPELEVQLNIDENQEGVRLNEQGHNLAVTILESIAGNNEEEEEFEDDE